MYSFKPGYYADVRIERCSTANIAYMSGMLKVFTERETCGAFIRVFDGKRWYYASTESLSDVQNQLDRLYGLAAADPAIEDHPTVKRFEVNRAEKKLFAENNVAKIDIERKNDFIKSLFPVISSAEEVKMWVIQYVDKHNEYEFYSSKGACIKHDLQTCGMTAFMAMATAEGKVFQHSYQIGDVDFEVIAQKSADGLKEAVKEGLEVLYKAKEVTPGRYPVILSPEAAGVFAHESFGHKSEADFMLGDETLKKEWAIGKKVGSDVLSVVDSGIPVGSGYVPYDDEGTAATKTYLIKNGVLAGRLHSAETAAALNEGVTGNARAVNSSFEPIVRMTTTYIEGGDSTFEELVSKVKRGYYVKFIKHGSGMSTFTIAPSVSYEIVDGKLGDPVNISVISGTVFETLGLVEALSKDVQLLSFVTGGCGKMEQYPLPVGFGAPYVLVSQMNVQ